MIANALVSLKERGLEIAAKAFLAGKLEKFGSVTRLEIDTRAKGVCIEMALKGETSLVEVNCRYEVHRANGVTEVLLQEAKASREWISAVLGEFAVGQKFKVPNAVGMLL
jgi:hypothetical protein